MVISLTDFGPKCDVFPRLLAITGVWGVASARGRARARGMKSRLLFGGGRVKKGSKNEGLSEQFHREKAVHFYREVLHFLCQKSGQNGPNPGFGPSYTLFGRYQTKNWSK
jgi:hypothetical protein